MKGGARPGAGRKKGSKSKKTAKVKAALEKALNSGKKDPLTFMLDMMNEPVPVREEGEDPVVFAMRVSAWREERFEAGKAALPYCHPKLHNIEHSGPDGGPVQHKIEIEFVSPRGR